MSEVITRGSSRERASMPGSGTAPPTQTPPPIVSAGMSRGDMYRERLRSRNPLVNAFVTVVTGKPLRGEEPLVKLSGIQKVFFNLAMLIAVWGALIAATMALPKIGYWVIGLAPIWFVLLIALVGRLRAMQVEVGHHAVHAEAAIKEWVNKLFAHIATIIPLAQNPKDYWDDHLKRHHRGKVFTTLGDADAKFLYDLGFRPGMSRRELYRVLWRTICSVRFHWIFLKARFTSSVVTADALHRLGLVCWLGMLAAVAMFVPGWVFFAAVVLPMGPLYHVSSLLQFLTEHRWLITPGPAKGKFDYASRCVGRFALVPPPEAGLVGFQAALAWTGWGLRMIPEVLYRLGVLVGDMPAHDQHHLAGPLGQDTHGWPEAIYERQRAIDAGDVLGLADREVYGLKAALDWVFDGYAAAEPISE